MVDTIEEIMSSKVITCDVKASIQEAARIMRDRYISCLIVLHNNSPCGIITERDIVYRLVTKNLDPTETIVKEIMSSPLKTVAPDENVYYASRIMITNHIKKLPVVKGKKLVGIITQTDLANYFADQRKEFILDNLRKSIKAAYPV
ncbi:MAG TPA: CBS domain-containing protein [Candidatus Nanoarchaeia archaeon]|nr:CBS domain-containing protein [Candidatus Nanoarchaeia archaeon]